MKSLLIIALLFGGFFGVAEAMSRLHPREPVMQLNSYCYGATPCLACRSCTACKYCASDGGKCGTCARKR